MLWFILSIAIGLFASLLTFFAFDDGYLWEKEQLGGGAALSMPSVDDVGTQDKEVIKEYVQNEIIPATKYFVLMDEYELCSRREYEFLYVIVIHLPLYHIAVTHAKELIPLGNIFLTFIVLALFIAEIFTASVLYEKKFSIDRFSMDDERITKIKEDIRCEDIADHKALNNQIIHIRLNYLISHAKEIRYRLLARKLVVAVGVFTYLLFVPIPE